MSGRLLRTERNESSIHLEPLMADMFLHALLTPRVQEAQQHYYGRTYAVARDAPLPDELTDGEREFIESRNSFYISCTTEGGWPYIQHRGGTRGFLE